MSGGSGDGRAARLADRLRLVRLSLRMIAGRRWWLSAIFVLTWPAFQLWRVAMGWQQPFQAESAQSLLIGSALTGLAILLGGRIIAGEIDRRTLEIAYTVPGGTQRVWLAKMAAAVGLIALCEIVLALAVFLFLTDFPLAALYGALQAAVFYMVLSMALAALFKSEATGALITVGILILNFFIGQALPRISPFFNPSAIERRRDAPDPTTLWAWTIQNRIGFALVIVAITALAFARSERREKMLGG